MKRNSGLRNGIERFFVSADRAAEHKERRWQIMWQRGEIVGRGIDILDVVTARFEHALEAGEMLEGNVADGEDGAHCPASATRAVACSLRGVIRHQPQAQTCNATITAKAS